MEFTLYLYKVLRDFFASWVYPMVSRGSIKPRPAVGDIRVIPRPPQLYNLPPRFADLKKEILTDEGPVVEAWKEILAELKTVTSEIERVGSDIIPQVEFKELHSLGDAQIRNIRRRGCVVIRNVVDDDKVLEWKELLREYIKLNPQITGFPEYAKQFFDVYWSRSQLEARSHPNVLTVSSWLNNFFHIPPHLKNDPEKAPLVSLNTPLSYADRFRIRYPSPTQWTAHPPHIDGGSIEKWEVPEIRDTCYKDILEGNWRKHDPYDITGRWNANTDKYGRPNQCSVFRTWQGWLSMSTTGPKEGTLCLFSDLLLSNAYIFLRPFFSPIKPASEFQDREEFLASENWRFDSSNSQFPGISMVGDRMMFSGQVLDSETHPHIRVDTTMVSVPKVNPGDMVFWHCDGIHSVETDHQGSGDSSVMYIPAMPLTPRNLDYIKRQRDSFLRGLPGPDFPQFNQKPEMERGESNHVKRGVITDIHSAGLQAMGLGNEPFNLEGAMPNERRVLEMANEALIEN